MPGTYIDGGCVRTVKCHACKGGIPKNTKHLVAWGSGYGYVRICQRCLMDIAIQCRGDGKLKIFLDRNNLRVR